MKKKHTKHPHRQRQQYGEYQRERKMKGGGRKYRRDK